MSQNQSFVFSEQMGELNKVDMPVPVPGADEVLIKVHACGICHSDKFVKLGAMGNSFPRCPGHEVTGEVVSSGSNAHAQKFKAGELVGVGWHGGHCGHCEACSDGDMVCCESGNITGISRDGGYQQYMTAHATAVAKLPPGMDPLQAAPLLCAGVTVFNALRTNPGKLGGICAVQGVGGLGHLAVQFASKMGYKVVVVSRSAAKKEEAMALGAHHYIASDTEDVGQALTALGGATVALATAPDAASMGPLIQGLGRNGTLVVLGADPGHIPVGPFDLIMRRKAIRGHPSGTARDSEDCLAFAQLHSVKVKTEVFPFEKAPEAYAAMMAGKYRVVLKVC
eukprot:CAMPEP_0196584230 /NCGR_PEP_ID=MMETSP1081-20130531/46279_1 /TAXON_ID=36882 /ORGANISM="Pyramimonas amylifera, Strain CCMP720" /LENGTH=337 /DNA_ID=CAMNT_0041905365 /DNA_START=163 /DNA_END=1176 /DNA_ORIENTATION=+